MATTGLAALKILEIIRVTASAVLFDEAVMASVQRNFILAAIGFLELSLCYGFFHALNKELLAGDHVGALTGFYCTFTTQPTIGFGDVYPIGRLGSAPYLWRDRTAAVLNLQAVRAVRCDG